MGIRYLDEAPKSRLRYLDEEPAPVANTQPVDVQPSDPYAETLAEMPWWQRQLVSAGGQLAKSAQGVAQLVGADRDLDLERAAEVAAKEAPVGAMVGDIAKFAPAMFASGIAAPAAIAGAIGAATATNNRGMSGLMDAGTTALGAKAAQYIPAIAGQLRNVLPTQEGVVGRNLPTSVSRFLPSVDDRMYGSLDRAREAVQKIYGGPGGEASQRLAQAAGQDVRTAQALSGSDDIGRRSAVMEDLLASRKGGINLSEEEFYANQIARQNQARLAELQRMAGGVSETEAAAARDTARKSIEGQLAPIRERILAEANVGGKVIAPLERSADDMLKEAALLEKQALEQTRLQRPADDLLDRVKLLREDAAKQQTLANTVSDYGYSKLSVSPIYDDIVKTLDDPALGASVNVENVLQGVLSQVEKWVGKGGGVIDANALYQIRKSGVNEAVDKLLAGANPAASKKLSAKLSGQLKPLIDDAIENAGGTGWKNYITKYGDELNKVNEAELIDVARKMYSSGDQKGFIDLIRGESSDVVKKIMTATNDIKSISKFPALSKIASEVERDQLIASSKSGDVAKRTMSALENELADKSLTAKLPNLLNRYVVLANDALSRGNMKLSSGMYKELEKAMQDPQAMKRLIDMLPPEQRSKMMGYISKASKAGKVVAAGTGERMRGQ